MKADALSQLLDVILDDLSARFIINLPEEELSSVTRICFGLEQAHWFYEDFFRPLHPVLPSVNLRAFTAALFSHCPLLWKFSGQHEAAFDDFLKYKIRVPVRGAIMLNQNMDKCVLVKGWKASSGWGFPKGKIDQGEDDADCAVREVREECGFDISRHLDSAEFIDMVMREQTVRLYVVRGVPLDTKFEPQTRKEISKIDWFSLDDLPTYKKDASKEQPGKVPGKYYMVAPFLGPLRRWIKRHKSKSKKQVEVSTENAADEYKATTMERIDTNHDGEASSQALKLLLGIVDEPVDAPEDDFGIAEEGSTYASETLDLASLFQKSEIDTSATNATIKRSRQPSIPVNLLDTSIETSIFDQLKPALFRAPLQPMTQPIHQADLTGFMPAQHHRNLAFETRHPLPLLHSQALPPLHSNVGPYLALAPSNTLPSMPPPESQSMCQTGSLPQPGFISGPPGLVTTQVASVPSISPGKIKSNPNAPALLALLKPADRIARNEVSSPNVHTHQQYERTLIAGDLAGGKPPVNADHKQSLLALLKPGKDTGHSDLGHSVNQPSTYADQDSKQGKTQQQVAEKEAFLLNYLTQAAARSYP